MGCILYWSISHFFSCINFRDLIPSKWGLSESMNYKCMDKPSCAMNMCGFKVGGKCGWGVDRMWVTGTISPPTFYQGLVLLHNYEPPFASNEFVGPISL